MYGQGLACWGIRVWSFRTLFRFYVQTSSQFIIGFTNQLACKIERPSCASAARLTDGEKQAPLLTYTQTSWGLPLGGIPPSSPRQDKR